MEMLHRAALTTLLLVAGFLTTRDALADVASPAPVTYIDSNGYRRVWVFVKNKANGHLAVNHFDGLAWEWLDHGLRYRHDVVPSREGGRSRSRD